jgi:hypothetical protein
VRAVNSEADKAALFEARIKAQRVLAQERDKAVLRVAAESDKAVEVLAAEVARAAKVVADDSVEAADLVIETARIQALFVEAVAAEVARTVTPRVSNLQFKLNVLATFVLVGLMVVALLLQLQGQHLDTQVDRLCALHPGTCKP